MSIIGNITSTISQYTGIEQKKKTEEKRKAVEDLLKTFEDKAKDIDKKR